MTQIERILNPTALRFRRESLDVAEPQVPLPLQLPSHPPDPPHVIRPSVLDA